MSASDLVVASPPPSPGPPPAGASEPALPLRLSVLSGQFVGRREAALAASFAAFLGGAPGAALDLWFGTEAAGRLRADPAALRGAIDRDIAAIDAKLSAQLDAVLHHPRLRRFEGSWRGLAWLTERPDFGPRVKLRVLHLPWAELCRDLDRAAEFDQSLLFRKVYEDEFGTPGGEPYGLLVIDHEVRHRPAPGFPTDDVGAIASLASIAAAAFAPIVLGASPALLEVDEFTELARATDATAPLRNSEHARWRGLAARADMRFIGIALPRILARPPWEDDGTRAEGFRYRETAPDVASRVWMNAGYAFGAVVTRAFAQFGWPADIRGVDTDRYGGGLVDGVALEPFRTDPDHVWVRPSVDVVLTDRQERALIEAGLMPLAALPYSTELLFGAVRSLAVPQRYQGSNAAAADANARLSVQMNSILCASRFAHHLKMKGRQMVGSFRTADEIERQLQAWLIGYVNANLSGGNESRARSPLVNGRVTVSELPGKPGSFGCVVQLQPHYQLDDVAATFQLVTDLGGQRPEGR